MDRPSVPEDHDPTPNVPQQVAQESDDLERANPSVIDLVVELAARGDPRDHRDVGTSEQVRQPRGLSPRRPRHHHRGHLGLSALVQHHERGAPLVEASAILGPDPVPEASDLPLVPVDGSELWFLGREAETEQ